MYRVLVCLYQILSNILYIIYIHIYLSMFHSYIFIHTQIHGTAYIYIYIATLGISWPFLNEIRRISPSDSPAVRCFPKTWWKQPGETPVRPGE